MRRWVVVLKNDGGPVTRVGRLKEVHVIHDRAPTEKCLTRMEYAMRACCDLLNRWRHRCLSGLRPFIPRFRSQAPRGEVQGPLGPSQLPPPSRPQLPDPPVELTGLVGRGVGAVEVAWPGLDVVTQDDRLSMHGVIGGPPEPVLMPTAFCGRAGAAVGHARPGPMMAFAWPYRSPATAGDRQGPARAA